MSKPAKVVHRLSLGKLAAELQCDSVLAQRYPDGWRKLLNEPALVSDVIRKAMSTQGPLPPSQPRKEWMVFPLSGDAPLERYLNRLATDCWEVFEVLKEPEADRYKVIAFREKQRAGDLPHA